MAKKEPQKLRYFTEKVKRGIILMYVKPIGGIIDHETKIFYFYLKTEAHHFCRL